MRCGIASSKGFFKKDAKPFQTIDYVSFQFLWLHREDLLSKPDVVVGNEINFIWIIVALDDINHIFQDKKYA